MVANQYRPRIEIHYCTDCRFILRASWLSQELLMTFGDQLGELALVPSHDGIFEVYLDSDLLFSKKQEGCFPEAKQLKQLVRDRVNPEMSLGHSDK